MPKITLQKWKNFLAFMRHGTKSLSHGKNKWSGMCFALISTSKTWSHFLAVWNISWTWVFNLLSAPTWVHPILILKICMHMNQRVSWTEMKLGWSVLLQWRCVIMAQMFEDVNDGCARAFIGKGQRTVPHCVGQHEVWFHFTVDTWYEGSMVIYILYGELGWE